MNAEPIEGERLTTWRVLTGGNRIALDFVATDGESHSIVLPVDTLSGLMMTLPRMLQSALDERFPQRLLSASFSNWRGGNWSSRRPRMV